MSFKELFSNEVYSKTGLARYIIMSGCILHYGWALLMFLDPRCMGSTPISGIIYIMGGSKILTELMLIACSSLALWYISLRDGATLSSRKYAFLLLPQLWLLCASAGASIYAAYKGYYLDAITQPGLFIIVQRPHAFILAGELPVIVMALLYLTAVIFNSRKKVRCGPIS